MCGTNPRDCDSAGVWEGALILVSTYPGSFCEVMAGSSGVKHQHHKWTSLALGVILFFGSCTRLSMPGLTEDREMGTMPALPRACHAVEERVSHAATGAAQCGSEKGLWASRRVEGLSPWEEGMGQDPAERWEVPDLREQALCDLLELETSGESSVFFHRIPRNRIFQSQHQNNNNWGAVLCIVGYLATSLASTHRMPISATPAVTTKNVSRLCPLFPGDKPLA